MWRHLLYAVCIAEAALLAAVLVAVEIQPDSLGLAPSPRARQLCGWGAVALMVGCGYALVAWLRSLLSGARARRSLISAAMARRPVHPIAGRGTRDEHDRSALEHGVPQAGCQTAAGSRRPGPARRTTARIRHALHRLPPSLRALLVAVPAIVVASACGSLPSVPDPYSRDYTWIDAADVGPAGPPEQRADPGPPDANCGRDIYAG